jgi:threonyl-tRNA synthetase
MENNHASDKLSTDKLYCIRHSLAHVLAQAVLTLRPNSKLAFGPPVEHGFYYDFELSAPLTPEDFPKIEEKMREIINQKQRFEQRSLPAKEAIEMLRAAGEHYKVEYGEELVSKGETELGFYKNGPFEDMCRGPHVAHTGELPKKAFAVDMLAGAYWRGDETRIQLTRIYALAFETEEELKKFTEARQLAKERDHRKLGSELELFTINDEVGPGLPLWLPNGTVIRDALENFAKEVEFRAGYVRVATPHITKAGLYYKSGHLPYYKDSMFPPMQREHKEGEQPEEPYYLKPMNCPHHHMVYKSRPRSYRELPLRLAEYGTCYRNEDSGALSGLLRVRMLSMNDSHIYCTPEQLKAEFRAVLDLHEFYYKKFRLSDFWMRLSLHDPANKDKYLDDPQAWAFSEGVIEDVLKEMGTRYDSRIGEAAFYGPKVDFQIRNVIGREETASTNQLDFAARDRFDLSFIGEDGKHHKPYVIHRAPLGTHERFIAFLIEHFGGAFPTWMAPTQAVVIPVSEKFTDYAMKIKDALRDDLIRAECDLSAESLNKKIRNNVTHKIPNILVVGGRDQESESVTWRRYVDPNQKTLKFEEFRATIKKWISEREMDNFVG